MDIKRTRHATYNINWHFVWMPKFQRPILVGQLAERLVELLNQKTAELDGEIFDINVQPDHVHMFCSFPPTLAPYQIMYRLRNFTAHKLRNEFPELKTRLPNLWTRSYYVGTAGQVSAETIQRYIEEQKRK